MGELGSRKKQRFSSRVLWKTWLNKLEMDLWFGVSMGVV